jgi:hypothetical protein
MQLLFSLYMTPNKRQHWRRTFTQRRWAFTQRVGRTSIRASRRRADPPFADDMTLVPQLRIDVGVFVGSSSCTGSSCRRCSWRGDLLPLIFRQITNLLLGRLPLLCTRFSNTRALVALALTQIQAPVTAFTGLGNWASDVNEYLIKRKIVTNGVLRWATKSC